MLYKDVLFHGCSSFIQLNSSILDLRWTYEMFKNGEKTDNQGISRRIRAKTPSL